MGNPVLLLRLEGPLQSWGTRSRWDVRDTATEPTKSGVIGLLGCALGLPMRDPQLEELDRALRFGVRVEHPGMVMTDYHTVTDYLPAADGGFRISGGTSTQKRQPSKIAAEGHRPATILSPRAYLEDAAFLVALERNPAELETDMLTRCAAALQSPRWPLFLGRKACVPTRPIYDYFDTRYTGIEDAFERHPWSWLGANHLARTGLPRSPLPAWIEDPTGDIVRQDAIRTNASRTYGFRAVRPLFFKAVAEPGPHPEAN